MAIINRQRSAHAPGDNLTEWYRIQNSADSSEADVYLFSEIGGWFGIWADEFVDELRKLDVGKINLHINSPGGSVFDGVAIYNSLVSHKASITAYVEGLAASAASFIAQAGDEIVMRRGSTMMIHDALAAVYGNQQDMLDVAEVLDKISNNVADIYAYRAGGTIEAWRETMRAETWYSAQEAVDAGLADKVYGDSSDTSTDVEDTLLSKFFNYNGRNSAPSPERVRQLVSNTVKEKIVSTRNSADAPATPEAPAPAVPATPPTEEEETGTQPTAPDAEPTPASQPSEPSGAPASGDPNARNVFRVNNVATTDFAAVQRHIDTLEEFQRETVTNSRRDFVKQLAGDNRILASQIGPTEEFVLDLSNEQYAKWVASWNAAPPVALVGTQVEGNSSGSSATSAQADRIEVLKGIVRQHQLAGQSEDRIKENSSYKELMQLEPTFKL
jgi:ATP-dependent Clp endopeptidase proteolytic subunit ClpP